MRLTWSTGRHRSTIWKVLKRHGQSARRRGERQIHRRYGWADAGALLHIDALRAGEVRPARAFWATGQRAEEHKTRQAGKTVVIGVVDDHTRLAYCELHSEESAITVSATLRRAAAWMREQGCGPVQAVMSDNHKAYTSGLFTELLADLGARQILIPLHVSPGPSRRCSTASRASSGGAGCAVAVRRSPRSSPPCRGR